MGMFGAYQGRHALFGLRLFRYKIHAAADFIINILAKLQHLAYIANFFCKKKSKKVVIPPRTTEVHLACRMPKAKCKPKDFF